MSHRKKNKVKIFCYPFSSNCGNLVDARGGLIIHNRESGAAIAKSRAAPATVSGECRSECHWETGKVDLHDDT